VKLLLDTQLLLWAAGQPDRLSTKACNLMSDANNELLFNAASLWEIAIKASLGREDFRVEPRLLRRGLLDNGYVELPVTSRMRWVLKACLRFTKIRSTACCWLRPSAKASPYSLPTRN
jgi:PIN domain nuclease of toxin-antitoxin system